VFRRNIPGEVEQRASDLLSDKFLPLDGLRDMLVLPVCESTELVGATLPAPRPGAAEEGEGPPEFHGERRTVRWGEPGDAAWDMGA